MMRLTKLCTVSLMAVALIAAVGQAASSSVDVVGVGNITWAGGGASISAAENTNIAGSWAAASADDPVGNGPTENSASKSQGWDVLSWYTSGPAWTTTFTANFSVSELLDTTNVGDQAYDDILIKMELFGNQGGLIDSDSFTVASLVEDGTDLDLATPVTLNVTTPESQVQGSNEGTLKITVEVMAGAYTAEQTPPPPPPTTIPAPGAIILTSLGMGLVSWLRTRRTL